MSELEAFSKSIIKAAAQKLSPLSFLSGQVRKMDRNDVDKLAIAYLLAQVNTRKRAVVLETERNAQVVNLALVDRANLARNGPPEGGKKWEDWAAKSENAQAASTVRARWQREDDAAAERGAQFRAEVDGIVDKFKEATITEWTEKLLLSKFALGDGTETTWGAATREQHLYRVNMHKAHAVAGVEGAARHQQAIDELDATGCRTLGDAVAVAA